MAEYIEREALVYDFEHCGAESATINAIVYRIKLHKAADVVPVVHGRWIPCDPDSDVRFYCSECETEISTSWDYDSDAMWSFCPYCGARMDGE